MSCHMSPNVCRTTDGVVRLLVQRLVDQKRLVSAKQAMCRISVSLLHVALIAHIPGIHLASVNLTSKLLISASAGDLCMLYCSVPLHPAHITLLCYLVHQPAFASKIDVNQLVHQCFSVSQNHQCESFEIQL